MDWVQLRLWWGLWWEWNVWVWVELQKGSTERFGLGTGRNKRTWRCVGLGKGLLNVLREATDRIEEEGRQTILETLHSKSHFVLHITRFSYCRVLNNYVRIFYCPKATLDHQRGKNLPRTRLCNNWVL